MPNVLQDVSLVLLWALINANLVKTSPPPPLIQTHPYRPPPELRTTNTSEQTLAALPVPLVSSLTPTFFTFVNSAVPSATPAKTTPKSASMLHHAPPTFSSWPATAVVWQSVLTDFTPIPLPEHAHNVIQAAVCAQEQVSAPAQLARSTVQRLQRIRKRTSRRSARQCAH